jgi:hypothetical protein
MAHPSRRGAFLRPRRFAELPTIRLFFWADARLGSGGRQERCLRTVPTAFSPKDFSVIKDWDTQNQHHLSTDFYRSPLPATAPDGEVPFANHAFATELRPSSFSVQNLKSCSLLYFSEKICQKAQQSVSGLVRTMNEG